MTDKPNVPFADKLSALVALEVAKHDPEITGEVIERLLHSLAFTIAIACGGNKERIEEMLTGAEHYLAETTVGFTDFGAFMNKESR